jgi:hypothetical protein
MYCVRPYDCFDSTDDSFLWRPKLIRTIDTCFHLVLPSSGQSAIGAHTTQCCSQRNRSTASTNRLISASHSTDRHIPKRVQDSSSERCTVASVLTETLWLTSQSACPFTQSASGWHSRAFERTLSSRPTSQLDAGHSLRTVRPTQQASLQLRLQRRSLLRSATCFLTMPHQFFFS